MKKRNQSGHHFLQDVVRGATYQIKTSSTDAQTNYSQYVKSIQSDGFTLGTDSDVNASGATAISWNWKMGGAASTNTNGTISAQVSANTTAGMSIATWTGTGSNGSVGHGLSDVDCMIIKDLSNSRDIYFWVKDRIFNSINFNYNILF